MAFFSQSNFSPLLQILNDYEAPHEQKSRQFSNSRGCSSPRQCSNTRQCSKPHQCSKIQAPSTFLPPFDVREFTHAYHLDGELPGVDQSNIEIEFTDPHTLVIKGHLDRNYNNDDNDNDSSSSRSSSPAGWRQATVEDEDAASTSSASTADTAASAPTEKEKPHFWASERSFGDFQRTFSFTARVDQDSVRASFKNGVLSVVVPKEAAPTPKKIRIL
ncbi:Heat shock protein [Penicillium sp. IBT 31633x]|nr:Heat shock protein [Penicillium sp. IBT 31633x]